jgi:hypothetical protein
VIFRVIFKIFFWIPKKIYNSFGLLKNPGRDIVDSSSKLTSMYDNMNERRLLNLQHPECFWMCFGYWLFLDSDTNDYDTNDGRNGRSFASKGRHFRTLRDACENMSRLVVTQALDGLHSGDRILGTLEIMMRYLCCSPNSIKNIREFV